jgi:hypothetical protein
MDVRYVAISGLHCPRYVLCENARLLPFSLFGWMLGSRDERRFGCGPCPTSALAGLLLLLLLLCIALRLQPMNFVTAPTDARNGGGDD